MPWLNLSPFDRTTADNLRLVLVHQIWPGESEYGRSIQTVDMVQRLDPGEAEVCTPYTQTMSRSDCLITQYYGITQIRRVLLVVVLLTA